MAVKRGLNTARGLGALIPQSKQNSAAKSAAPESEAAEASVEKTKDAATKASKQAKPAKKSSTNTKKSAAKAAAKPAAKPVKAAASKAKDAKSTSKPAAKTSLKEAAKPAAKAAKAGGTKAKEAKAAKAAQPKPSAQASAKPAPTQDAGGISTLRISEVVPNKQQPRKLFDDEALAELSASIEQHGVLQPLLVQKKGRYYEIIAGERRWRAAKEAGLKEIPAVIKDFSPQEAVEISLIENIQREDLNAVEEARAYRRLLEEFGLTQDALAKRVAKSRSAVTNALRLLNLDERVQELLIAGRISAGHARALLSLESTELQNRAADLILKNDLSVRETEALAKSLLRPGRRAKKKLDAQLEAILMDLQEQLTEKLGTKVRIRQGRGKHGKIEIEYYSQDELDRLIELLR